MTITLTYGDIKRLVLETINELTARHSSNSDFDEFSTDYVGNGLGSQRCGWGIYFSTDEYAGDKYRDLAVNAAKDTRTTSEYLKNAVRGLFGGAKNFKWKTGAYEYVVELPEDNGHNYIDWDGPKIDGLECRYGLPELDDNGGQLPETPFASQYEYISRRIPGGAKRLSLDLDEMGYDGIKVDSYKYIQSTYPRRGGYDVFVIFNDKKIKIVDKITHIKGTKNPTKPLFKHNL